MKVCFVSIIGRPNVGKSTLLNQILDYDLSIISNKPHTTRDQINGIYNEEDYQIVFIDTPGIHKAKYKIGEVLNQQSFESLKDVDLVLFLSPANEEIGKGDLLIIGKIQDIKNKIAVITKVDLEKDNREKLDAKAALLKTYGFETILGISSKYKATINDLIAEIKKHTYESEPFYNTEYVTDKSISFIAKEVIRESAIKLLQDEMPHSIAVVIDSFEEHEDQPYKIYATIYVARESQKGIVIGKNGALIKKIGQNARYKLSQQFGHHVILFTNVKVNKSWVNEEKQIKRMGY
ncbi:GTPase Era [Candidatus Mycoplasma pogonae]